MEHIDSQVSQTKDKFCSDYTERKNKINDKEKDIDIYQEKIRTFKSNLSYWYDHLKYAGDA